MTETIGDVEHIKKLIPHRPPMLLVDEVISQDKTSIVCKKTFHDEEFFHHGHYPGNPITPGLILCEACVQAGAILAAAFVDYDGVPVLARVNDVKFKHIVRPGDTVTLHVKRQDKLSTAHYMSGKVMVGDKTAVTLTFAVTVVDRE